MWIGYNNMNYSQVSLIYYPFPDKLQYDVFLKYQVWLRPLKGTFYVRSFKMFIRQKKKYEKVWLIQLVIMFGKNTSCFTVEVKQFHQSLSKPAAIHFFFSKKTYLMDLKLSNTNSKETFIAKATFLLVNGTLW